MKKQTSTIPERPELPPVSFDWDQSTWQKMGRAMLDVAYTAGFDWQARRPSAEADQISSSHIHDQPYPESAADLPSLADLLLREVVPYSAYNGHPRWFAYITSTPTPIGILADMVASALNQNTALWRIAPIATTVELQTIEWIKSMLDYPADAEGVFVSGGQMANIVAHTVFRDAKAPWDTRKYGMAGPAGSAAPRFRVYVSTETHYCHQQAVELLGMGAEAIRLVPVDERFRMRMDALQQMITEDRQQGHLPIAVVATAGTVGTGAVDPLDEILKLCRSEGLWSHVDGAYGAFAAIAPGATGILKAMREADSIACDPHKWLYAPIDAGVTLVRHKGFLNRSFSFNAEYLRTDDSSSRVNLFERSPENSRPFRALKVWLALKAYGVNGYRQMIDRDIRLAGYLAELIEAHPLLELTAAPDLSITCWRAVPRNNLSSSELDTLQKRIIHELEQRGIAMISNARMRDGGTALRACIVNFRTTPEDIELLVRASADLGQELLA